MSQAPLGSAPPAGNLMGSIGGSTSGDSGLDLGAAAPFAQMGMNYVGTKMGWIRYFTTAGLKYYFHVNNNYVKNKLKVLLCPLLHKKWKRDGQPDAQQQITYRPPSDDVNAPDLYLPLMAIITYILLMGVLLGVYHNFTPEYLGLTASSAMVVIVLEILLIRVGFHVLGFPNPPSLLDLLAYCSYKFVGLPIALIVGIFAGSSALYLSVLVLAALNAIFMMRTMGGVMKPIGQQIMQVQQAGSKNTFLLLIGVLQLISNYILIHNAIPSTPDSPALETLSTNEM
jgi:protein transport protein YIF1